METLIAGFVSSSTVLFLLAKFNMRRVLGYDWVVDVIFTVALTLLFSGTYAGMTAAMIGGLLLSMKLIILKKFLGAERFNFRTRRWETVK